MRTWSVKDGEFPANAQEADGYVITGSPASVNDPLPWIARLLDLIRELHQRRTPMVGICFGHQAIARALGGQVGPSPGGWRFGIAPTRFNQVLPFMEPPARDLDMYAAHREQVLALPTGAEIIGGDPFFPSASFVIGDHILTTQYHPEFTPEFMQALVEPMSHLMPADALDESKSQLRRQAQGATFVAWCACFLEGRRPA